MNRRMILPRIVRVALMAGVFGAVLVSSVFAGQVDDAEASNQENWRQAIAQTEVPAEGCFHASYPGLTWSRTECSVAPNIPYRPRSGRISQTVGDGNDYAAEVTTGLISKSIGYFPSVTGVTAEKGTLGANDYSLQLNSNFMHTAACNGATDPAKCLAWEQFIYSSGYESVFMQYWLIYWNNPCPSGWYSDGAGDCYTNSAAVTVPLEAITKLATLKLSGTAKKGGVDTTVFTAGTEAYSITGLDSVLDVATAWKESEFNIIGDGDGSAAKFNAGSSVTVQITVSNGTTKTPKCVSHAGTTAETNNLNLGSCAAVGGTYSHIRFTESN